MCASGLYGPRELSYASNRPQALTAYESLGPIDSVLTAAGGLVGAGVDFAGSLWNNSLVGLYTRGELSSTASALWGGVGDGLSFLKGRYGQSGGLGILGSDLQGLPGLFSDYVTSGFAGDRLRTGQALLDGRSPFMAGYDGLTFSSGAAFDGLLGAFSGGGAVAARGTGNLRGLNNLNDWSRYVGEGGIDVYPTKFNGLTAPGVSLTLKPGVILERRGEAAGRYLTNPDTPFEQLSLPIGSNTVPKQYRVLNEYTVETGTIAPWFDQPGGGTQYYTGANTIETLIENNILEEIK